jgi:hypothetical protein
VAIDTRSLASIAPAAARHFASLGKSRNAVLPATPPVTDPLKTTVTKIKVHMSSLHHRLLSRKLGIETHIYQLPQRVSHAQRC